MNAVLRTKAELLRLMREVDRQEVACQPYLQDANVVLAPPFSRVEQVAREQIGMHGRSDYFILCEVEGVGARRKLILWETKAPQLSPFRLDNNNRLVPTRSLVEAEMQLLYYWDEYRGNAAFRDRYGLRHEDDIRMGGIVIGRDDNWVEEPHRGLAPVTIEQLARTAHRIRSHHFYPDDFRVLTWDTIARAVADPDAQLAP